MYTSGTTAAPKAAILRHRHLVSYVFGSVEFAGAGEEEAALVSVPPYHVAGLANLVSNVFTGRRLVYLPAFTPEHWLASARQERVTHAMVVPTMLARVVESLPEGQGADVPSLRTLSYGGSRIAASVVERALAAFPDTDFVNAYGLTETSSTICVLGPEDHRAAVAPDADEAARRRLGSAGRLFPGVEGQVRDAAGSVLGPGEVGELWVRGEQVSGEYLGRGSALDDEGWFPTRDRALVDEEGYVFIEGRADDTIIRGGENIAPAEIEEVLVQHPAVAEAAVVGVPDEEWGQRIGAVVVVAEGHQVDPDELRGGPGRTCGRPRPPTSSTSGSPCPTPTPASCSAARSRRASTRPTEAPAQRRSAATRPRQTVRATASAEGAARTSARGAPSTTASAGSPTRSARPRPPAGSAGVPRNSSSAGPGSRRSPAPSTTPEAVRRSMAAAMASHGSSGPKGASDPAATATPARCSEAQR